MGSGSGWMDNLVMGDPVPEGLGNGGAGDGGIVVGERVGV